MKQLDHDSVVEIVGFVCATAGLFFLGLTLSGLVLGLALGLIVAAAILIMVANVR